MRCWISYRDIPAGNNYATEIADVLKACSSLIVVVTNNSISSTEVSKEVHLAVKHKKLIVPINNEDLNLEGNLEYHLEGTHYELLHQMKATSFDRLAANLIDTHGSHLRNLYDSAEIASEENANHPIQSNVDLPRKSEFDLLDESEYGYIKNNIKSVVAGFFLVLVCLALIANTMFYDKDDVSKKLAAKHSIPSFISIPGGTYTIGNSSSQPNIEHMDETPKSNVHITPFDISEKEITVSQYNIFLKSEGKQEIQNVDVYGEHPVTEVTWLEAQDYTEWLSLSQGNTYKFRLPTEAEWEYVARAQSTKRTKYHFGDSITDRQANFALAYPGSEYNTTPVGTFPANEFGLYDMHGNVSEWTCSSYSPLYNGNESKCAEKSTEDVLVIRGGSWNDTVEKLRTAYRNYNQPNYKGAYLGFRVVRETNNNHN